MSQLTAELSPVQRAVISLLASAPAAGASPAAVTIPERLHLCRRILDRLIPAGRSWAEAAAVAKGRPGSPTVIAEELLSGPAVVARQLQLTVQTLRRIEQGLPPVLPGTVRRMANGQLSVPVFPTRGYFDSLAFMGLHAEVRMQPAIEQPDLHGPLVEKARRGTITGITGVLGAGNVSSIPATDSLNRIMFDGRRVILKMNPVNDYLAPVFEQVFSPLIQKNLLQIVTGGAEVGQAMVQHPDVADVHVTGSAATHDAIVWGTDPAEREARKKANSPLLQKPVTSELGNVTPWLIVPGRYSGRQLDSQARHVANSITNNASFNCLATKVIVTWKKWDQRQEFLNLVARYLKSTPLRPAYYPGAAERFRRFSETSTSPDDQNCLPWTLLTGQSCEDRPELFNEESFVCVCAETPLDGETPENFLQLATDFVNEQLTGTLCASVTIPSDFRSQHPASVARCLQSLRYGSVCVNQWSGLAYGLTSPPWGAYPGATLCNVQSGIGNVHNTYLLDQFEKTVLEGPLVNFPKPIWFPSHKNSLRVAEQLLALYDRPSVLKLPALFMAAITG